MGDVIMYTRIRELREDKDLKQQEIADYLKIDQSNYSKIELGKQYLKDDILIKLAFFYNTSIDYLLGITNEKLPYPRVNMRVKK